MRIWRGVKTALDWPQQENSLLYDSSRRSVLCVRKCHTSFISLLFNVNTGKRGCIDSCCCMWWSQWSFGISQRHVQHTQPLQWCSSSSIPCLLFSSKGTIVLKSRWRASAHCCVLVTTHSRLVAIVRVCQVERAQKTDKTQYYFYMGFGIKAIKWI